MVKRAIVIGGGLAGGAAALRLARAGTPVTLLERERGPHDKVCGEFLSIEAWQDLEQMGLAPRALGAVPIDTLRVHRGRTAIEAALPFLAWSLSRRVLDEALLDAGRRAGADIVRGVRVTGLRGATVLSADGEREASHVLLATGKHDLRGMPRGAQAKRGGYVGLKMHWRLPPDAMRALGSTIELILFAKGYAGLQPVGRDEVNLCLIARQDDLASGGGGVEALLARLRRETVLGERLADGEPLFARPLAIANLPYGFVHQPAHQPLPQLWRLGDQAAMTASLTGDGMAVALRSARMAAACIAAGGVAGEYHRQLAAHCSGQVRRAMRLQHLCEQPLALSAAVAAARIWPGLLTRAAALTRLPPWPAHQPQHGGIR